RARRGGRPRCRRGARRGAPRGPRRSRRRPGAPWWPGWRNRCRGRAVPWEGSFAGEGGAVGADGRGKRGGLGGAGAPGDEGGGGRGALRGPRGSRRRPGAPWWPGWRNRCGGRAVPWEGSFAGGGGEVGADGRGKRGGLGGAGAPGREGRGRGEHSRRAAHPTTPDRLPAGYRKVMCTTVPEPEQRRT